MMRLSTYGLTADTRGLVEQYAPTIYRYDCIEALLDADRESRWARLRDSGGVSPTEVS